MIVCARYPPPLSRDSPVIVEMDISIAWVLDKVMGSGVSIIRRREGAKSVGIEGEACRRQALRPVRKHSVPEGLPSASRPVPCCAACWRARSRRRGVQRQAVVGGKTRGRNVRGGEGRKRSGSLPASSGGAADNSSLRCPAQTPHDKGHRLSPHLAPFLPLLLRNRTLIAPPLSMHPPTCAATSRRV